MGLKEIIRVWSHEAKEHADKRGIDTTTAHNNSFDAFRHAYTSAKITRDGMGGRYEARALGDFYEQNNDWFQAQKPDEEAMDKHNNAIGEETGELAKQNDWSDDQIADAVKQAIEQWQLIVRPGSPADVPPPGAIGVDKQSGYAWDSLIDWPGDRPGVDGSQVLVNPYDLKLDY
jgi:hypothetical protein